MDMKDSPSRLDRRRRALEAIPPVARNVTDGTLVEERRFRGLTLEQAIGYLEHLGGERIDERTVEGDGWTARLETRIAPVGPSYRLTEIVIEWRGDPDHLEAIITRFRLKAFRAPG